MEDDPRKRKLTGDEPRETPTAAPATVNPSVHAVIPNPSVRTRFKERVEKSE